jgi:hypothetical protein
VNFGDVGHIKTMVVMMMMAMNGMHMQRVQMRMSVVVVQVRVEMRVMVTTLLIYFEAYAGHSYADVAETWRCWTMVDANEILHT